MDRNKEILTHCPHFYTIINYEYYSDDTISAKLIDIYEKYIFSVDLNDKTSLIKVEKLDNVLYQYIKDYAFRTQVKTDITKIRVRKGINVIDTVVSSIINMFEEYENLKFRKVQLTRWI